MTHLIIHADQIRPGDQVFVEGAFREVLSAEPPTPGFGRDASGKTLEIQTVDVAHTLKVSRDDLVKVIRRDLAGFVVTLRRVHAGLIVESERHGNHEPGTSDASTHNLEWAGLLFEALTGVKPTGELPQSAPRKQR